LCLIVENTPHSKARLVLQIHKANPEKLIEFALSLRIQK